MKYWFKIKECNKCVYVKDTKNDNVILCLHIDDMLIVGNNNKMSKFTTNILKSRFDMKIWVCLMWYLELKFQEY